MRARRGGLQRSPMANAHMPLQAEEVSCDREEAEEANIGTLMLRFTMCTREPDNTPDSPLPVYTTMFGWVFMVTFVLECSTKPMLVRDLQRWR